MIKVLVALQARRISQLETIIGKLIVDTPLGADIDMLSAEELKMVDEISDEYLARTNSGIEPAVVSEGKVYDFNATIREELAEARRRVSDPKRENKEKVGDE